MIVLNLRRRTRRLTFLIVLLLASGGAAPAQQMVDAASAEAQYEAAFASVLEFSEHGQPIFVIQAWGGVIMAATMADRARAREAGGSPSSGEAVAERVFERWRQERPGTGGPDLFRAFRIQDPAQKRAAIAALADRYPDDPLVVWQAANDLRQSGERSRARSVAETFVERNPDHPAGYRMLAAAAAGNTTRLAEVYQRWARAVPGDPSLVGFWMGSDLPRQDPEATRRLLSELFASRPTGDAGLRACLEVLRRAGSALAGDAGPAFAGDARACVARIAADPEVPASVAERATSAMAETAAADGDFSGLMAALDSLEPEARVRAVIAASRRLKAPERCADRVELLSAAAENPGDKDGYRSIASALKSCGDQPAARDLYTTLLRQAPADKVPAIVGTQAVKVNGVYRGELPPGVAEILEQRLREEAGAEGLFKALDVVYRVAGRASGATPSDPGGRRFELLRRWQRQAPASFRGEQATDLARGLVARGEPRAAVELLEGQLEARFENDHAELLWELYHQAASPQRAERFAADLIASDNSQRQRSGNTLAARSAVMRGDVATAKSHYLEALKGHYPHRDVAVELLTMLRWRGERSPKEGPKGTTSLEPVARRICEQAELMETGWSPSGTKLAGVSQCAADLLARAGSDEAAAALLADSGAELPEDRQALRQLAVTAQSAGRPEVAERALRRVVELDPRDDNGWSNLGVFLERQSRVDALEELLERSRELFSPPPTYLYRATGRALAAADRPRRAVEVLIEARDTLPETAGGDWSRGWIDHELAPAYRSLGRHAVAAGSGPAPVAAFVPPGASELAAEMAGGTADEWSPPGGGQTIRLVADRLHSGAGGRYDPQAAAELYARAAATGDPLATLRLALLRQLEPASAPDGAVGAQPLYLRAAGAVEDLAAEGDAYAQYLVGTAALIGLGGSPDFAAARGWLEPAAAEGESWAWHNLAWMAETGRGLGKPDGGAALDAYRRASEAGNTRSMIDVARLTLTHYSSGTSCQEGLRWLERSTRAGNARAAAFLGKLLFYGRGKCVGRDPEAALPWLEAAVASHQPGAAYDLGVALLSIGDDAGRARGMALLEQVAGRPDALAVETLAFLHATGIAVPRNSVKAGELTAEALRLGSDGFGHLRRQIPSSEVFQQLAQDGARRLEALAAKADPAATALLARLQAIGLGVEVDPERAVSLARRAAADGEASAMRLLRTAYQQGEGVAADSAESLRWQRRCAEAGDSQCMLFHGRDLLEGEEIARDREAGLAWIRRSAEAGNWWAIVDLGRFYEQGRHGVPRDPDRAAAWKRRLADLGDAESTGWLLYHRP